MSDSGEGRWTSIAAIDVGVPAPVLTTALYSRFASRDLDEFADKLLSAMRKEFGGHAEKKASAVASDRDLPDPEAVAERAAECVAEQARAAIADHGRFTFAVSGGHTPWAMFANLAGRGRCPGSRSRSSRSTSGSRPTATPIATSRTCAQSLPRARRRGRASSRCR